MNRTEQLHINNRSVLHRPAADPEHVLASLVLLHGYGADEFDLMGLAPFFDENIQVLSIRGSQLTPFGGASWFDIDMLADGSLKFNIEQAQVSTQGVIDIISELQKQGLVPGKQVILAGFSQGATISNLITLQKPELTRALLIMSGRLPDNVSDLCRDSSLFSGLPVFAGHGLQDTVIPASFGREIVSFWDPIADLEHHEYPMGHEISQAELTDIQRWLSSILS